MKVIALCGNPDVDKTNTIKFLIGKLINQGATDRYHSYKIKHPTNDYEIILEYDDKILFITTKGDSRSLISNAYNDMKCEASRLKISKADVFICATHFNADSMNLLFEIANGRTSNFTIYPHIVLKADIDKTHRDVLKYRKAAEIEALI